MCVEKIWAKFTWNVLRGWPALTAFVAMYYAKHDGDEEL